MGLSLARFFASLVVPAAALVACGETDTPAPAGTPGGTTGPVSVEDFPARYLDTFCKVVSSCCNSSGVAYDDAYCRRNNAFDPGKYAALTAGTTTRFDPEGAGRCLDAVVAAGCAVKDDIDQPGCEGTFVGVVPQGGKCYDNLACAPVAGKRVGCGSIQGEDGPGICAVFVVAQAGEVCGGDFYGECAKGLVCEDFSKPSAVCVPAPRVGEKCTLGQPCEEGTVCSSTTFQCTPRIADGGACSSTFDCTEESRCSESKRVCEPRAADGAACTSSEDCLSLRCIGGRCGQKVLQSCDGDDGDGADGDTR